MSQFDFGSLDPTVVSGTVLATDLNSWRTAVHSSHKGSTPPIYAVAGMLWVDDSTTAWNLRMYVSGTISTTSNWPIIATIDSVTKVAGVKTVLPTSAVKSSAYSLADTDVGGTIPLSSTSASFNLTLLSAASVGKGGLVALVNIGTANAVSLVADGLDTILGLSTFSVRFGESIILVSDGVSAWYPLFKQFNPNLTLLGELVVTKLTETAVSLTGTAINLALGTLFYKTISGSTTLTITNPAAAGKVSSFTLELTNGGSSVLTWFAGVTWPGGTPPSLSTSGVDVLTFFTRDGGTTWRGFLSGKGMA